ncbi:MAG: vanX, partial [Gammaproteobacteria bacterium]|nr:vanX [Gammaproteobacteria bacterium]
MKKYNIALLAFCIIFFVSPLMALPNDFVYLKEIDPSIIQDLKYLTHDNIIGRPIAGYELPRCILTKQAAMALANVQKKLNQQSLSLKVFDCYRPQTAVNDFIAWSKDAADQKMKLQYYPRINK